jgi:hypothetical protein
MTRIKRIGADLFQFLSAMIRFIRVIRVLLTLRSIDTSLEGDAT